MEKDWNIYKEAIERTEHVFGENEITEYLRAELFVLNDMKDKILKWFANGKTGLSSKEMAFAVLGIKTNDSFGPHYPHDPSDFNRCLLLVKAVPEIKNLFHRIEKISPIWKKIIENWEIIESQFLEEAGLDWTKSNKAPKTYALIKSLKC